MFVLAPCAHPRDIASRLGAVVPPPSAFSGEDESIDVLPLSKIDSLAEAQRDDDNRIRDEEEQQRAAK